MPSISPKPLAIDLFCGLFQAKILLGAYTPVKQLMARWTQYPNHVPLGIASQSPCAVALKFWSMCDFKNTIFAARFTCLWHCWISAFKAIERYILKLSRCLIGWSADLILPSIPDLSKLSCRFNGTLIGAISLVTIRLYNIKMITTPYTISADQGDIRLFSSSYAPDLTLASERAIYLVRSL